METHAPVSTKEDIRQEQGRQTLPPAERLATGQHWDAQKRTRHSGVCVHQHKYINRASSFLTSVLKEDMCYSTCCNSQAIVGNLNFFFDIQINSNSLRALSLWRGQSLVSEGSSSLTSGALVSMWWVSSQSPNAPVLPDVFPLSQCLKVVKVWCILVIRTKTTLKSLANITNSFTYLQYLFLSSVYTLC